LGAFFVPWCLGGDIGYFSFSWVETDNPLIAVAQVTSTAIKAVANAGIWIYNQIF
jgi:hypothetical protein